MSKKAFLTFSRFLWAFALAGLPIAAGAAPATPVFVQEVNRAPFTQSIEALGTLRANESVTLTATLTETISALHFNDGQRVTAGDVLAEMTNNEEQALLAEARSAVEEAERQYERERSLTSAKLSTQAVLDERRRAYEMAEARLHAVQSRLRDLLIVAPFDGVVGLRNISVGALVRPGDVITTLDDNITMKLDMTVPAVYLDVLRPGLPVVAKTRGLEAESFRGEIVSIASRVDPVTRSVVVRALIPNKDLMLRPGLLMTVELQKQAREVLVVAEEAIVQRGQRAYVYVVDGNSSPATVVEREVTVGARRPGIVEVVEGLSEGEQVVIHGAMKLRSGSEVRIAAVATGQESLQQLLKQAGQATSAPVVN